MDDRNIDVLIYVKGIINELERDNFFLPSENPMIEKDIFEKYLIKQCNENITNFNDPEIDDDQLISVIQETTKDVLIVTINSLYDKGLVDISGIDEDGHCCYKATKIGIEVNNQINKKNM
jgi:hypothetical protein